MAISWTIIVLGALLQGMQCNADDSSTTAPKGTTQSIQDATTAKTTASSISLSSTQITPSSTQSNEAVTTSVTLESSAHSANLNKSEHTSLPSSSTDSNKPTTPSITESTSLVQTKPTLPVTNLPTVQNGATTTQVTTKIPETQNTGATLTEPNNSTQSSSTTDAATNRKQGTTALNIPATTTSAEDGTTQLSSTQTTPSPSIVTENSTSSTEAPKDSKSTASENHETTQAQTTASTTDQDIKNSTPIPQTIFDHSFDLSSSSTENHIVSEACNTLGQNIKGNCTARVIIDDKKLTVTVTIYAEKMISTENYKPRETDRGDAKDGTEDKNTQTTPDTKNGTEDKNMQTPGTKNGTEGENKGTIPDTLIAIMASCGALVLILCCFAAYCTYHRRSYRKNQQHLTEELQTVENGYHDNPTLEVMEVQPEMQEKKMTMNGEFNDSWIVPIDNLLKEDIPDEEDTHL